MTTGGDAWFNGDHAVDDNNSSDCGMTMMTGAVVVDDGRRR